MLESFRWTPTIWVLAPAVALTVAALYKSFTATNPSVLSLVVAVILLVLCVGALWDRVFSILLASMLLMLTGYNVVRHLGGAEDCGCFAFTVSPLLTAAMDAFAAGCAYWCRARDRLGVKRTWEVFIFTGMMAIGIGVSASHLSNEGTGKVGDILVQHSAQGGADNLPAPALHRRTCILYRSDCERCREALPFIKLHVGPDRPTETPPVILDFRARTVATVFGGDPLPAEEFSALFSKFENAKLPLIVVIENNMVKEVHSWAAFGH